MLIIFKQKLGLVSVTAKFEADTASAAQQEIKQAGLTVIGIKHKGNPKKTVMAYQFDVTFEKLKDSTSVPEILYFVKKLASRGWVVDKENFINYHYGYKKPYVVDSEPKIQSIKKCQKPLAFNDGRISNDFIPWDSLFFSNSASKEIA